MRKFWKTCFVGASLLCPALGWAQGEARTQVWCETLRFIYQDNGDEASARALNCTDSTALAGSIHDTLQARAFYQEINAATAGKPVDTLVGAVIRRLRDNKQRAQDATRQAKVDSLEAVLRARVAPRVAAAPAEATSAPTETPDALRTVGVPWWVHLLWPTLLLALAWPVALYLLREQLNGRIDRRVRIRAYESNIRELAQRLHALEAAPAAPPPAPAAPPTPTPAAPPAVTKRPDPPATKPETWLRYAKQPVQGGFHTQRLTDQPGSDSIFVLYMDAATPDLATFVVSNDVQAQQYALHYGYDFFSESCDYTPAVGQHARVVTEEPGQLRRDGLQWRIVQKARVRFV